MNNTKRDPAACATGFSLWRGRRDSPGRSDGMLARREELPSVRFSLAMNVLPSSDSCVIFFSPVSNARATAAPFGVLARPLLRVTAYPFLVSDRPLMDVRDCFFIQRTSFRYSSCVLTDYYKYATLISSECFEEIQDANRPWNRGALILFLSVFFESA